MNGKRNLVIGVLVVLACAGIMMGALGRTKMASVKFAELASKRPDERCEIYGILDAKSIKPIKGANLVQFDLVEEKTGERLRVLYDNPSIALPATFPAASHAKVMGSYVAADQQFVGDTALTKCPSKYDEKTDLDLVRKGEVERWQKATGYKGEEAAPKTAAPAALQLRAIKF